MCNPASCFFGFMGVSSAIVFANMGAVSRDTQDIFQYYTCAWAPTNVSPQPLLWVCNAIFGLQSVLSVICNLCYAIFAMESLRCNLCRPIFGMLCFWIFAMQSLLCNLCSAIFAMPWWPARCPKADFEIRGFCAFVACRLEPDNFPVDVTGAPNLDQIAPLEPSPVFQSKWSGHTSPCKNIRKNTNISSEIKRRLLESCCRGRDLCWSNSSGCLSTLLHLSGLLSCCICSQSELRNHMLFCWLFIFWICLIINWPCVDIFNYFLICYCCVFTCLPGQQHMV